MSDTLAICIPTYKRPQLLKLLLQDLWKQSRLPDHVIVIDGDPDNGTVLELLLSLARPNIAITYLPSNHSNVAYQRYLGWRVAQKYELMLYLDDDIRVVQEDFIEKVLYPFTWASRKIVGVTCKIDFPSTNASLKSPSGTYKKLASLFSSFGNSYSIAPGGTTPIGDRIAPIDIGDDYVKVDWLYGGVMAFRTSALKTGCFPNDMFALAHIHCGLGEDTFISRCAGTNGELLLALCTTVQHPNADRSQAYPSREKQRAYAIAYSRRFQNDYYRYPTPPAFGDRLALIRHYIGVIVLNWVEAIVSCRTYRYAYAWGYTTGAVRGLIQKPTARNLTPHIDWSDDAETAIASMQVI